MVAEEVSAEGEAAADFEGEVPEDLAEAGAGADSEVADVLQEGISAGAVLEVGTFAAVILAVGATLAEVVALAATGPSAVAILVVAISAAQAEVSVEDVAAILVVG